MVVVEILPSNHSRVNGGKFLDVGRGARVDG